MLNVYISVQDIRKGFPENQEVKLLKYRDVGTMEEAFQNIREQFGNFVDKYPDFKLVAHADAIHHLMISAQRNPTDNGAAIVINGFLICVVYKKGEMHGV